MKIFILILIAGLLVGLVLMDAQAQTSPSYDLTWHVISSGGGSLLSSDGQYALNGTVGQPATMLLSGGSYSLQSGFWQLPSSHAVYLPLTVK